MDKIYIFGAHSRSQTLGIYLTKLNPRIKIVGFLINNDEINETNIDGVPVIDIRNEGSFDTELPVYLGTRGVFHADISKALIDIGFSEIIPNTPELDIKLRNDFLAAYFQEKSWKYEKLENFLVDNTNVQHTVGIYEIKSAFDKPLTQPGEIYSHRSVLQVGKALTDSRISDLSDDIGENISDKNKQFCELTGLYWIWKNAQDEIVGLEHYRRHFILPENWQGIMEWYEIDVILPTPLYVHPSLAENYRARHIASDLEFVYQYMRCQDEADASGFVKFMEENPLYSPCNMFITRRDILNELCEWMFPILFAVAENGGTREDPYQNRYPGFLSERLISYFFEKNKDRFYRVYCDKNFLS